MICFDSEFFPQNFVLQLNNDQKSLDFYYNALIKSSELWQISVNRKARPVVEGEHDKSWNDHGSGIGALYITNGENIVMIFSNPFFAQCTVFIVWPKTFDWVDNWYWLET